MPDGILDTVQWLEFRNDNAGTVPAYGVMQVTDVVVLEPGRVVVTVDQPDSSGDTGNCVINGPVDVASGDTGICTRTGVLAALYDDGSGTPAAGDSWGPAASSWKLTKNSGGFLSLGAPTNTTLHLAMFSLQPASNSILAVLVDKDYTGGEHIAYSWVEVTASASTPVTYTHTSKLGCKGSTPAYHARNFDLPVQVHLFGVGVSEGCTITGSGTVDGWSVVRLFKDPNGGDFYVFNDEPHVDLFRRTGTTDSDGEIGYERYWDQENAVWADGREVRIVSTG